MMCSSGFEGLVLPAVTVSVPPAFLCSSRIVQVERRKKPAVKTPVPRQQPCRLLLSVSSNQKVRQNPGPLSSLLPIHPPYAACEKLRFSRQRLNADLVAPKEGVTLVLTLEMDAKLSVDKSQIPSRRPTHRNSRSGPGRPTECWYRLR